jgi:hypothetical protein
MTPGHLPIHLPRGMPWHKHLRITHPDWQYRAIAQVHATAPLTLSVPGHDLPCYSWPVWIEGSTSSQLNTDHQRQRFRMARVIDADTLELNDVNGVSIRAAGGQLVYQSPMDFAGCTARMIFHGPDGPLLTLTDSAGLALSLGSIDINLTGGQVTDLEQARRHELIVTHADGTDIRWLCGEVRTHDCRHQSC